jgi:hypothetical protein
MIKKTRNFFESIKEFSNKFNNKTEFMDFLLDSEEGILAQYRNFNSSLSRYHFKLSTGDVPFEDVVLISEVFEWPSNKTVFKFKKLLDMQFGILHGLDELEAYKVRKEEVAYEDELTLKVENAIHSLQRGVCERDLEKRVFELEVSLGFLLDYIDTIHKERSK